ncbi:hypothetical protein ABZY31_25410 [Streptomyces sp. NPDC006529]|uniref:hypothetical protein n=1 Tax=Streptomyces sp. NPDC006529 TaxID=3157177 RepID=UPI0033AB50A6
MSDYAIPEAEADVGGEQAQVRGAVAARPPETGTDPDEAVQAAGNTECLHTLLDTAVTRRSVEEVADLVTLLERSGQVPDAARQALRAAAVSRPIEDVLSLAVLFSKEDDPRFAGGPPPVDEPGPSAVDEPGPPPRFAPEPPPGFAPEAAARHPDRAEAAGRAPAGTSRESAGRPSRAAREPGVPGRGLRWPVAVALVVSALVSLPRDPAAFLAHGGLPAWALLALAGLCLALAVLVPVRDRGGVWAATAGTAVGILTVHALASVLDLDLYGGVGGALLPWPTGASVVAACLTAVLSGMALLYRSDRPRPAQAPPAQAPEAAFDPLDARSADAAAGRARDLAYEGEATAPRGN